MNRRKFIKSAGYTVGGIAIASASSPLIFPDKNATFDPNNSFWANEFLLVNPSLKENIKVDIAIIGGGYTGLSSAYHLKKYNPNLNVIILEAKQVGHGASGRHGGMLLPQPPTESFEIYDTENPVLHQQTYELTVKNINKIKELVAQSGLDCDLKTDGYCHTIIEEEDIAYYKKYVETVNKLGMPLEFWNEDQTSEALGTEYYSASVYDPNGGSLHAVKFINILKKTAQDLGVIIYENSMVNEIVEGEKIDLLINNSFKVTASKIIIATNAYTSKLGYFKTRIIPVHAQTAVTKPLTDKQIEEMGWNSRLPFYDSRNYLMHLVLRDDNRIVIGGGDADYLFRSNLHYSGDLNKVLDMTKLELTRLYPSLKNIEFENIWNGLLCMTSDDVPRIGVKGKYNNIYFGLAYNGQGVNMSFMFGDVLASVINNKTHGWENTMYYNFDDGLNSYIPPEPFRWLGSSLLMKFYKRKDKKMIE